MKYQRIEDMRIDQDLTIKEISALLECNRDVYSRYEKRNPRHPDRLCDPACTVL
mgnify:FL=1